MKKSFKILFIFPMLAILMFLLSCSTGYNKYANQYYDEGLVFYEKMEYGRSIDSFNKVLEVAPYGKDNDLVYYNLGMAYYKQRKYDDSIYQYTKALELVPKEDNKRKFNILMRRGIAYQEIKDFDNSIKDYSDAIHLMPRNDNIKDVYLNRAWCWISKGDYDRAVEDFDSALSIDNKFDASYYGRAYVWNKKGDLQRAIIDVKEAVKLNPGNENYNDLLYKIQSSMTKE